VAQLGGFRRAAAKLNTTQPANSGRLLERDRGRVRPTARGIVLLGYAGRMLALRAEMQAAMQDTGVLRGTVRLRVPETIVHTGFGRLIHALVAAHPRLTVDLLVDVSPRLCSGLIAGKLDVAILLGPVVAAGVLDLPLSVFPLVWVARPGLIEGAPSMADWVRWPILTCARGTGLYEELCALFGDAPVRLFDNSALSAVIRMALDGIGVGVIAAGAVQAERADGRLVALPGPALSPLVFTASTTGRPGPAVWARSLRPSRQTWSVPIMRADRCRCAKTIGAARLIVAECLHDPRHEPRRFPPVLPRRRAGGAYVRPGPRLRTGQRRDRARRSCRQFRAVLPLERAGLPGAGHVRAR